MVDCVHGGTNCGAGKNNSCGDLAGWNQNTWVIPGGSSTMGPNLSGLSCPIDF